MLRFAWAALAASSLSIGMVSAAQAQDVMGSGIAGSMAENSAERPIAFAAEAPEGAALVIITQDGSVPASAPLGASEREAVAMAVAAAEFEGKGGSALSLRGIGGRPLVVLARLDKDADAQDRRELGGTLARELKGEKREIAIVGIEGAGAMADAAFGYALGQYRFDRYKSDRDELPSADAVIFVGPDAAGASALWDARHGALAESVRFARDLANEPASAIYPDSFIARTRAAFRGVPNVEITVLDQADFRRLGMGAIAGVGQGSPRGARLMLISYRGAEGPPLALVGKGITFDTGGISIKSNSGMWAMKADMSGAAAVTGAALSLAKSRAPVNIVAVAALAENMPDGNAQRPGDIVRTMSGKTIEIRSTDAEGRLVLADAIEYTIDRHQPRALVDIATLTGSVGRAVGPEFAGLFAHDDAIADHVEEVAGQVGEPVWRLPLHPKYAEAIKSSYADIKNSDASPAPGASAGAHFVGHFVPEELPWAHIDMAGVDMVENATSFTPVGASGYGVRLLDELVRSWPEGE